MAEVTGISWCDSTANFWIGCQKVSAACDHCYAEDLMGTDGSRFRRVGWGPHADRMRVKQGWNDVAKWQRAAAANGGVDPVLGRRRRVFVNSLSDFFDNHRSVVWRDEAWDLIRQSPGLIFILLTKRPQNIARMIPAFWEEIAERVWLMTTVENQEEADRRIPALLESCDGRAWPAVLGLSCEPLLGPVDLVESLGFWEPGEQIRTPDGGSFTTESPRPPEPLIDWVITGGESGEHARPWNPRWATDLQQQCAAAGVAFHHKQNGEWAPDCLCGRPNPCVTTPRPEPGSRGVMFRCGKARSGHHLGGKVYREFPEAA